MVGGLVASLGGVRRLGLRQPRRPGATIVLFALAGFVATAPVGMLLDRRRRAPVPFDAESLPLHAEADERHATCTGRAAATSRSSTATMSTTSTTATATRSTSPGRGSTMTSTEPE